MLREIRQKKSENDHMIMPENFNENLEQKRGATIIKDTNFSVVGAIFIPCQRRRDIGLSMSVLPSVCPSKPVGIYWVDTCWVLAIYSVGVQNKYPTNLRDLLGTYGDCWVL